VTARTPSRPRRASVTSLGADPDMLDQVARTLEQARKYRANPVLMRNLRAYTHKSRADLAALLARYPGIKPHAP
jgi:hypothetical protein